MADHSGKELAQKLTQGLKTLGVQVNGKDLEVAFEGRTVGPARFVFQAAGSTKNLKADEVMAAIDAARTQHSYDPVKLDWLNEFKAFIDPRNGEIGNNKVDPIARTANHAAVIDNLRTVTWDLQSQGIDDLAAHKGANQKTGHGNLVKVARALTNIAENKGYETLNFSVDRSGNLNYTGDYASAVKIVKNIVLQDPEMRIDATTLHAKGDALVSAITQRPGQLALDKAHTGYSTDKLVNLIENKNILLTIKRENTPIHLENGVEIYGERAEQKQPEAKKPDNKMAKQGQKEAKAAAAAAVPSKLFNLVKEGAKSLSAHQGHEKTYEGLDQIDHGGLAEPAVIKELPNVSVPDMSESFTPPANSGGGKAPAKGGKRR